MRFLVRNHSVAHAEAMKWKESIDPSVYKELLDAVVHEEKHDCSIVSGDDLFLDRSGYGRTVQEALLDYLEPYIKHAKNKDDD